MFFPCSDLRLEPRPTGVEAGVVQVAEELFPELPLDVDPRAQPLQLVPQPPVRALAVACGLKFTKSWLVGVRFARIGLI